MAYVNNDKRFRKVDLAFDYLAFGKDVFGLWKRVSYFFKDHSLYTVIKKNHELIKSENSQKKIYICALGPSLKNVDLNKIDGDTIVVNNFFKLADTYPDFVPTYYLWIDDDIYRTQSEMDNAKYAMGLYQPRGTRFIINSKANHAEFIKDVDADKLYYMSTFRGEFHPNKDYKMTKVMPVSGNVASFAILLSILMGYKEIYLLGCDFSSFTTPKPFHCYNDKEEVKTLSLAQDLLAYAHVARYHENLQLLAERKDVRIYNSTKGSLIDAYPFKIVESLYK